MPEYDPLILRDQLRAQIDHAAKAKNDSEALMYLLEYLESVIDDINAWDAGGPTNHPEAEYTD